MKSVVVHFVQNTGGARKILALLLGLPALVGAACAGDENAGADRITEESAADIEFFEKRIRPVLIEHCYSCHAADAKSVKGSLQVDSREGLRTGGDSGPAVVPGDPGGSLLLQAMQHTSLEMPPDRKLSDEILHDFETWIRNGAVDPRVGGKIVAKGEMDLEKGRTFWSFQPLRKPEVPDRQADWMRNDIDRFVGARHEPGDAVAQEASPEVMIRRLTFVLTGLPPTLSQQRAFLNDWKESPSGAMEKTVDELLASPRFGERWGRHWLDVARFAESTGGGRSMMLPDAWRFRDYVIQSFNQDKPYNQLIREHLAGDLLPSSSDAQHDEQLIGAGYLMLGAINYEEQDKEALRMDVVDEQIDSMGRTFLGMTLGCCRCHDHKFDPIPSADYYALAGIFRSTKSLTPGNVCGFVTAPLKVGFDQAALDQWTAKDKELETRITRLKKGRKGKPSRSESLAAADLPGIIVDDTEATLDGNWKSSSFLRPFVGAGYQHSQEPRTGFSAAYETPLPADGEYVVRMVINAAESRSDKVPVVIFHADGESIAYANQKIVPEDGVFANLGRFRFEAAKPARVIVNSKDASPGYVIVDAIQFVPTAEMPAVIADAVRDADAESEAEREKRLAAVEEARKAHQKLKPAVPVAMCVAEEAEPSDWHLHVRGEIRNLGPVVPRGFLTVATPAGAKSRLSELTTASTSGRRELADWVASPDNPLTARVYVNRVWANVMGQGIVRTPDNFGETGERPTHPELLDYLASTLIEEGWSTKRLIRRLCLSGVFRMAAVGRPEQQTGDPGNLRLTRAVRRRLDAECLRDALLQCSGALTFQVTSGPTIAKISTYDNEYRHEAYPLTVRSVFVPSFRNTLLDLFEIFDSANPNVVSGKRTESIRPAQALYLMNSPFVMEQSQLMAGTFLKSSDYHAAELDQSIQAAWQLCLCREPTSEEMTSVKAILGEEPESVSAWTNVFHAIFASVDFRFLD